jgi:serine/threonine-protein kinase
MRQLAWVGRDGVAGETVGAAQPGVSAPALSPDGTRVVVMANEGEVGNIWVYDIERGTRTRLTFGTSRDWDPAWMPGGDEVAFWEGATRALSRTAADGSGETARLMARDLLDSGVPSFSSDGKWMAFWAKPTAQAQDIWVLDFEGDGDPVPLIETEFIEDTPRISPDDRFLAYASEESGRREVYLTRFPSGEGKWQVSANGGTFPVWSPVGGELFYLEGTVVKQVGVDLGSSPRLGTPRTLFDAVEAGFDVLGTARYEISRDGRQFLMIREIRAQGVTPGLVINYDWDAPFRE